LQKDLKPNSAVSDELEVLSILGRNTRKSISLFRRPHPIDPIKCKLEQNGLDETELIKIPGGCSRKSEILSGKGELSLAMISELHKKLNIPAEVLIAVY